MAAVVAATYVARLLIKHQPKQCGGGGSRTSGGIFLSSCLAGSLPSKLVSAVVVEFFACLSRFVDHYLLVSCYRPPVSATETASPRQVVCLPAECARLRWQCFAHLLLIIPSRHRHFAWSRLGSIVPEKGIMSLVFFNVTSFLTLSLSKSLL